MTHARRKPQNAQRTYGVLVGDIRDGELKRTGDSPHYEIWVMAGQDNYRIAVNVRSVDGSDVLVHYDPDYHDKSTQDLAGLASGPQSFRPLKTGPDGEGLDYIRDELFPIDDMTPIPDEGAGVTLKNLLDGQIERAKADDDAVVIAFGEFFQDAGADETFGFAPERGVHDIHFMQGNGGHFADDNRVRGDGALFICFKGGETMALFARFSVQAIATDDTTGAPKTTAAVE